MNSLLSLNQLSDLIELEALNELLDSLFGDVFEFIEITEFYENEEAGVLSYTLVLGIQQSIIFPIPGLDVLNLGIIRDNDDEWPLVLCEIIVEGAPVGITIRHFPLRVEINNPYLIPVPPEDSDDALNGFSFEIEGNFGINTELKIQAKLNAFSVPPFSITGTGLQLGLEDCRIISTSDDVDDSIISLGFDQNFRGIHAVSAQFFWDIPVQIGVNPLPGFRTVLQNLAIGNQGVSVTASQQFQVTEDGQVFDSDQTELLGSLFDTGWAFALQKLDIVIQENIPVGTGISGYLRIPFLNTIIKAQLAYQYHAENLYQLKVILDQKAQVPVIIPLGNPNYELQIENLHFLGEMSSSGDFSVKGQVGLTLNLPGLHLQAQSIEITFEHQEVQDNFVLKLENINVDGFGQIEQSQLVVVFIKNAQEQHELTLFELQVDMQWQDISNRIQLNQQTSMLPLPPDDAEVSLKINWQDDNLKFAVQAELDDVDQLWRFIPADMRPEVDDASIDIELNSVNGDFEGEISLGFALRLPDLMTLAPLQAAGLEQIIQLNSGAEDDWIKLRFTAECEQADNDAADSDTDNNSSAISASLENPLSLTMQLPGMILPEPPVFFQINKIALLNRFIWR